MFLRLFICLYILYVFIIYVFYLCLFYFNFLCENFEDVYILFQSLNETMLQIGLLM